MRSHYASNQRLLDRVCYLSRAPTKDTDLFGNEITVKHTFPYNPDSKTAPETAKRWADNTTYDHKTRQYVKGPEPEFLERANDPFSITIIDLDVRSEGGRAYKVVDTQDRCFDLREDQVLEVFKHVGILAGGQVPGQFVWGILGSQMRMVLVGGDLHKEMVAQLESLKNFKRDQALGRTPTEGTLKFGCIYRKRDGSHHVFLGKVKAPGAEKASFAFLKLPESPPLHEDLTTYDDLGEQYSEHAKHQRDASATVRGRQATARPSFTAHATSDAGIAMRNTRSTRTPRSSEMVVFLRAVSAATAWCSAARTRGCDQLAAQRAQRFPSSR